MEFILLPVISVIKIGQGNGLDVFFFFVSVKSRLRKQMFDIHDEVSVTFIAL